MIQEYTSAKTAINGKQGKLPLVFRKASIPTGAIVLDYGGGDKEAWKIAQKYLDQFDALELIYDPYNQTDRHNANVIGSCKFQGGADVAICSNVLNVIKELDVRIDVLKHIKELTKPNSTVYISVYEGNRDGIGRATQNNESYQNNKKTSDYLSEVESVFGNATIHGKIISAIVNKGEN